MITRAHMVMRYPESGSIAKAIELYPEKDILVFVVAKNIKPMMEEVVAKYRVAKAFYHDNKLVLDNGSIIIFKSSYERGLGYYREQFVMVDYL